MDQLIWIRSRGEPWNRGKLVGQKAPLRLKDIRAIRIRLQLGDRVRELALFDLAVDSKLTARPHRIKYAFTLHDHDGTRSRGFENAHGIPRAERYEVRAEPIASALGSALCGQKRALPAPCILPRKQMLASSHLTIWIAQSESEPPHECSSST